METTLVAVFDDQTEAQQALDALLAAGFSRDRTRLASSGNAAGDTRQASQHESVGEKIAHFFGFGDDEESTYSEAVRRGSCVLTVDAPDEDQAERAAEIIERYRPVDIDARQAEWRQSGWQPAAPTSDATSIPVVQERLQVGKREVQRGGIRVVARVVERPVEETVSLREEQATVERRPADRAVSAADSAFKDQTFEVRTTSEEAVVGKTARVVEDVVIGKETSTREQKVQDSVRKTEVEVEQVGNSGRYGGQERRRRTDGGYAGTERRAMQSQP